MGGAGSPTRRGWGTRIVCELFGHRGGHTTLRPISTGSSAPSRRGSLARITGWSRSISRAIWTSVCFVSTGARHRWLRFNPSSGSQRIQRRYRVAIWFTGVNRRSSIYLLNDNSIARGLFKKVRCLTRPTQPRQDAPFHRQGRRRSRPS